MREWQSKLQEEFPFMDRNSIADERNIYRKYGFECGGGWYELLRDCCQKITKRFAEEGVPIDLIPAQIKEKFGTLRFYYGYVDAPCGIAAFDNLLSGTSIRPVPGVTDEVDEKKRKLRQDIAKIVHEAEERSAVTCEICGKEGSLKTIGGRVDTLCDQCFEDTIRWRDQRRKDRRELSPQEYLDKYVRPMMEEDAGDSTAD